MSGRIRTVRTRSGSWSLRSSSTLPFCRLGRCCSRRLRPLLLRQVRGLARRAMMPRLTRPSPRASRWSRASRWRASTGVWATGYEASVLQRVRRFQAVAFTSISLPSHRVVRWSLWRCGRGLTSSANRWFATRLGRASVVDRDARRAPGRLNTDRTGLPARLS
jgi:hypothetical protein